MLDFLTTVIQVYVEFIPNELKQPPHLLDTNLCRYWSPILAHRWHRWLTD